MRTTTAMVQVAVALMGEPDERHYGYGLSKVSGVRSGVMYPILRRMLEEGWLSDGWEDATEAQGRPPRRYYLVTDKGKVALGALRVQVAADPRFRGLNLGWAT
jgi:PadR family transcriptional regulator PadR